MTIKQFKNHLKNKKGIPDYIEINGIEFKMSSYDMSGKEIFYENKDKKLELYITTENRYNSMKDVEVELLKN